MIIGERTLDWTVLQVELIQRLTPPEYVIYEPGQFIAVGTSQIYISLSETFQERNLTVHLEPELRHLNSALTARVEFTTGDLLFQDIPTVEVTDFAKIPSGSYAVHYSAHEPEGAPGRYVLTLFDHRAMGPFGDTD